MANRKSVKVSCIGDVNSKVSKSVTTKYALAAVLAVKVVMFGARLGCFWDRN